MISHSALTDEAPAVAVLLAHGGGAPEAALIGLPLLVLAVFFLLERRARKAEKAAETDGAADHYPKGTT